MTLIQKYQSYDAHHKICYRAASAHEYPICHWNSIEDEHHNLKEYHCQEYSESIQVQNDPLFQSSSLNFLGLLQLWLLLHIWARVISRS